MYNCQGSRSNANRVREAGEATPNSLESEENISTSEVDSSVSSKFRTHNYPVASQTTDNSTQASEYEDAESGLFVVCYSLLLEVAKAGWSMGLSKQLLYDTGRADLEYFCLIISLMIISVTNMMMLIIEFH